MLLTRHNLQLYQDLMRDLRAGIEADRFGNTAVQWATGLAAGDIEPL
jgi:queuine tRNA-ribosyltransferase